MIFRGGLIVTNTRASDYWPYNTPDNRPYCGYIITSLILIKHDDIADYWPQCR